MRSGKCGRCNLGQYICKEFLLLFGSDALRLTFGEHIVAVRQKVKKQASCIIGTWSPKLPDEMGLDPVAGCQIALLFAQG